MYPGNAARAIAQGVREANQFSWAPMQEVAKLFIGTVQKPAGQYGHSSTGASNGGLGVGAMDAFFATGTSALTKGLATAS